MNDSPFLDELPVSEHAWIVVCSGCLRTQHDGQWTDVQVVAVDGRPSGWCDDCARRRGAAASERA